MNLNLTGKYAMVCGSTQGIGRAAAEELATLGASVILVARNETKLKEVCKSLPTDAQQTHSWIAADFTQTDVLKQKLDDFFAGDQKLHILVNNTGGPPAGLVSEASIDEFLHAYNQHLICNHILMQAVLPSMKAEQYGRIINVISTSVKQPIPGLGVSNTTRGAVANWAKTLASEVGQYGITVNNVLPGTTETGRLWSIVRNKAAKSGKTEGEVIEAMQSTIPAGRFAEADEVGAAIAFLASPAAGYINGINLPVDGGRTKSL